MMNKLVKKMTAASAEEWDRVWGQCDYATYFHSREWAEIWSAGKPGKYQPDARLVIFEDGKQAILPLTRQKRYRGLVHTALSSPGGTYGGWISADALRSEQVAALVEILMGMGSLRWRVNPYFDAVNPHPQPLSSVGISYDPSPPTPPLARQGARGEKQSLLENGGIFAEGQSGQVLDLPLQDMFYGSLSKSGMLRTLVARGDNARLFLGGGKSAKVTADETHVLALGGDFEAILKRWNAGHRSGVKKAQRAGVTVRCASTLDDWRAYYGVYEDSVRRWGENAHGRQSWALFEAMYARQSANIRLWLADYQGQVIAGIVCFYAQKHVVYWHGAALEAHFELGPSKLVMYEAIRHACEAGMGYRWFDFNPSAGLEGVREFKRRFGAETVACPTVAVRAWWERGK